MSLLHADRSKKQSASWIDLSGLFGHNSGQDENTSCLANTLDIPHQPDRHLLFSKHQLALRENESTEEWQKTVNQAKRDAIISTNHDIVRKSLSIVLANRLGRRIQHMVAHRVKESGNSLESVLEPSSFRDITAQALIRAATYTPADVLVVQRAIHLLQTKWASPFALCLLESRSLMTPEWIEPLLKKAADKGVKMVKIEKDVNAMPQAHSDHTFTLAH